MIKLYTLLMEWISEYFYTNREGFIKPWFLRVGKGSVAPLKKCLPFSHDMHMVRLTPAHMYSACAKCKYRKATQYAWNYEPLDKYWLATGEFAQPICKEEQPSVTVRKHDAGH